MAPGAGGETFIASAHEALASFTDVEGYDLTCVTKKARRDDGARRARTMTTQLRTEMKE